MTDLKKSNRDFVGVALPTLIYIGVSDLAKFNKIDLEQTDHTKLAGDMNKPVLTKQVSDGPMDVIFQHWLDV